MRGLGLLALLGLNYAFLVTRHEFAHAAVVWSSGGQVVDWHLFPPQAGNLSWITEISPPRPPWVLRLQAAMPYLVSLALYAAALWALTGGRLPEWAVLHVGLTGLLFPILDLGTGVGGYWVGDNDLFWIFGRSGAGTRVFLSFWVAALAAIGAGVWRRRRSRRRA